MFDVISSCEHDKHGRISVMGKSSPLQTKKGLHTTRVTAGQLVLANGSFGHLLYI